MPTATTTEAARTVATNARAKYNRDVPPIDIADADAEPPEERVFRMPTETLPDPPKAAPAAQPAKDVSICIEAGPDGLRVRVDYVGTLGSIPAAIERLRAAGVLELVSASKCAPAPQAAPPNGAAAKKAAKRVTPAYDADGDPICPVHGKPLQEGGYGLYCPSKADGEYAGAKGYCNLRFEA